MTDTTTTASPTAMAPATEGRRVSPRVAVLISETRLFFREPANLFWIIVFPSLILVILGCVPMFREEKDDLGGLRLIDIYVPIAVLVAQIVAGIQAMPPTLTGYRERGILRRMSTTPARPSTLLAVQMLLNSALAVLSALLVLTVGRLVFSVDLPSHVGGYAVGLLLATAACLATGALVSALASTSKYAAGFASAIFFPALFCVGVWIPVRSMPDALANVVELTPFGAAASALEQAAAGGWPDWSLLGTLIAWAVVLTAAAIRWFRWE